MLFRSTSAPNKYAVAPDDTMMTLATAYLLGAEVDRKSVVQGKSVDLGGRRSIKKMNV